jgi:cobalt-precorrin 5A hydrolase
MERGPVIVAGFGFRAAATADSLRDALDRAGGHVDALATAADKADAPAFRAFAAASGLPVHGISPDAIRNQQTATASAASRNARGTGSLAEAAALAAAGPGARLLAPRAISGDRMATCALAIGPDSGADP